MSYIIRNKSGSFLTLETKDGKLLTLGVGKDIKLDILTDHINNMHRKGDIVIIPIVDIPVVSDVEEAKEKPIKVVNSSKIK